MNRLTRDFPAMLTALLPASLTLYAHVEHYMDRYDYDEHHGYSSRSYRDDAGIPQPAPTGDELTVADLPDWIYENILQECKRHRYQGQLVRLSLLNAAASGDPRTFATALQSAANEWLEDCSVLIETAAEQFDRRFAHNRDAFEPLCIQLAAKYGVKVGTIPFVSALRAEIEAQSEAESDRREALREDGLCIGYGASVEQWYDEYNSPLYSYSRIHALLEWIQEFQPLLFSSWEAAGRPSLK